MNVTDAYRKGRGVKGETHGRAKLTEAMVVEMRERRAAGERVTHLGTVFGVTKTMCSRICRGMAWDHVGGPRTGKGS